MRISIVNLNLVAKDAIGNCIIEQARFFVGRGDQVTIFIQDPPEQVPDDISALCRVVTLGQLREDSDGVFAATDIYIYHYPNRYSLIETITEIDGGLVIFYYHNVTPPELWNREEERHILRNGVEGVTLARYADLVLAPSAFNLADLSKRVELAPERMVELPLPLDTQAFRPGTPSEQLQHLYHLGDGPVLLFVGRLAHNKRIDLLVETLAAVRQHPHSPQPEVKLLLVGDNSSSPAYRQEAQEALERARQLGVADAVIFTGRVDQLPDYYRLASVYLSTSQHEGFCVPLIEAMASGVPVVAAASTAVPATIADAGLLVPVDPEGVVRATDMADAVVHVLQDTRLAEELRAKGLERASNFTVDKYHERLAAVIDQYATNLPFRTRPAPRLRAGEGQSIASPFDGNATDARRHSQKQTAYWPELNAAARVAMPEYTIRSGKPVVGELITWVRRNMTSHLKEPYLDLIVFRQQDFNLHSAWATNELADRLAQLEAQLEGMANELTERIMQLEKKQDRMQAQQFRLESHQARMDSKLEQGQIQASSGDAAVDTGDTGNMEALPQAAYGINYMSCHEAVGGSRQVEMALYEQFVPLFEGRSGPVLDLGCGQGPFLEVMHRHGICAQGVDIDPEMIEFCRGRGLDASQNDIFAALRGQADSSLGGIFCAHVIEHLPRTRLMELADLCQAKLQPGAAVVWITPNGGGLSALHATFYKDLTHTRPLHPDTLAFILESSGFVDVKTMTLSDMPAEMKLQPLPAGDDETNRILNENLSRLNQVLFGHLDCAAIGRRN